MTTTVSVTGTEIQVVSVGTAGSFGADGATGPTGATGAAGPQGAAGTGVPTTNLADGALITYSSSAAEFIATNEINNAATTISGGHF